MKKLKPEYCKVTTQDGHPLIIYDGGQNKTSLGKKLTFGIVNLAGIALWLYFFKIIVSMVAWYAGFDVAYSEWIRQGGWKGFRDFASDSAPFGFGMVLVLYTWAMINLVRFRNSNKRSERAGPSISDEARLCSLTTEELKLGRGLQTVIVFHDRFGKLSEVKDAHQ